MSLSLNLSGIGNWELIYFQQFVGDGQQRRLGNPFIEPIQLPTTTTSHVFLIGASYLEAKPSWSRAGWFYQEVGDINIDNSVIFEGDRSPTTNIDTNRQLIRLNTTQLIIFPKLSDSYKLRFEPFPWIPKITLAVWEYLGTETDTTEELINAVRAKLETIEIKIENLKTQ